MKLSFASKDWAVIMIPWVIVVVIVADLCLVVFLSSLENTPLDLPAPRSPFAQLVLG